MAKKAKDGEAYKAVLEDLVETINVTGGIRYESDGNAAPEADHEWIDLGSVYLDACAALGVAPVVSEDMRDEPDEDEDGEAEDADDEEDDGE